VKYLDTLEYRNYFNDVINKCNLVDKLDLEAILSYNLGLWMLVKITKMSLTLRVAERDLLLEKYETKKKDREAKQ
jgi:hypothetical protein